MRAGVQNPNGTFKPERHSLDFVVDGQSLWEARTFCSDIDQNDSHHSPKSDSGHIIEISNSGYREFAFS
jgi:hypothetical protein